jgi:uncharacterized protein YaiL (DUF2058 family)
MQNQMKIVVNCATGEVQEVPLTSQELEQMEKDRIAHEQELADRQKADAEQQALKDSAKAKLIAGQPLTEAEAAVLIA